MATRMAMRLFSWCFINKPEKSPKNIRESIQNIRKTIKKKAGFLGGCTGFAVTVLGVSLHIKIKQYEDEVRTS